MTDVDRSTWKFDLERWRAGEMPVTRQGERVRALADTGDLKGFPLVGFIEDRPDSSSWSLSGARNFARDNSLDLVHPPKVVQVRTVWFRHLSSKITRVSVNPKDWEPYDVAILRDEIGEVPLGEGYTNEALYPVAMPRLLSFACAIEAETLRRVKEANE